MRSGDYLKVCETLGLAFDPETGQHSLAALRPFAAGSVVHRFSPQESLPYPTYPSVQVDEDTHIHLAPDYLRYMNHSCEPAVFLDTQNGSIIALKAIGAGEAITYFYPSTEWAMARPFACLCKSGNCLGTIQGASQMDLNVLGQYRLAGHIHQQLKRLHGEYTHPETL